MEIYFSLSLFHESACQDLSPLDYKCMTSLRGVYLISIGFAYSSKVSGPILDFLILYQIILRKTAVENRFKIEKVFSTLSDGEFVTLAKLEFSLVQNFVVQETSK